MIDFSKCKCTIELTSEKLPEQLFAITDLGTNHIKVSVPNTTINQHRIKEVIATGVSEVVTRQVYLTEGSSFAPYLQFAVGEVDRLHNELFRQVMERTVELGAQCGTTDRMRAMVGEMLDQESVPKQESLTLREWSDKYRYSCGPSREEYYVMNRKEMEELNRSIEPTNIKKENETMKKVIEMTVCDCKDCKDESDGTLKWRGQTIDLCRSCAVKMSTAALYRHNWDAGTETSIEILQRMIDTIPPPPLWLEFFQEFGIDVK